MSDALPVGWMSASLGDLLVRIVGGGTPSKANETYFRGKIPFMTVKDMKERFPTNTVDHITPEAVADSSTTLVPAGTLVVATRMALGRAARPRVEVAINQDLRALFPVEALDVGFLEQWWRSRAKEISALGTGTTVQGIRIEDVRNLRIDVPPLGEQGRIVAKLETLLGKVEACQRRLAKIPRVLKRFRQSVLVAACSGRITADWRAKHSANSVASRQENGSRGGADDAEELPRAWRAMSLGSLTTLVTSGSRGWAKYYSDAGAIFIRAQDISGDTLDLAGIAHVSLPNKAEGLRTRVKLDDLLVTITGANVTKSARVGSELDEAYVSQHVALVRLKDSSLSRFVFYALLSPAHGRKQLSEAAYGQGKPGLNLDNIRDVRLDLPPLPEQHEIVRRVERLFALADQIEARYAKARAHVDKLTQSLLAKAFRGELVPQDPNDEPASALLARLRSRTSDAARPARRKVKAVA